MKICSWNVNSIRQRAHKDHDRLTPWLQAHQPDVACLQELQCTASQFPHDTVAQAGYRALVSAQKGKNGVALLTRLDAPVPQAVSYPWPPTPSAQHDVAKNEARFIAARVQGVVVASIYVPYGRTPNDAQWAHKLHFLADVKTWAEAIIQSGQCLALGGDFNVAPTASDAAHVDLLMAAGHPPPETLWPAWCDPRMRRGLQHLLDVGLHDVGALMPEGGRAPTLWDDRTFGPRAPYGVRIDLLLTCASMASRLREAQVHSSMRDGPKPSDHVPVAATFTDVQRIFGALSGSKLYGLQTPQSDTDYRGLFLPHRRDLLLGQVPKTECVQRAKAPGEKNHGHDVDLSFFSPTLFVQDLLAGQPSAWEMLFAPPWAHTADTTALGQTFMARLRSRSRELWPLEAASTVAFADRSVNTYLRRQPRAKGTPAADVRFEDSTTVGNEGKLLSHALRVLQQAQQMAHEGHITLPRPNTAELLAIKVGTARLNPVLANISALKAELQQLGAQQPHSSPAAVQASHAWAYGCVEELHDQHVMRGRWLQAGSAPWAPRPDPHQLTRTLLALDLAT